MTDSVVKLARLSPEHRAALVARARAATPDRPQARTVPRADPGKPIPASYTQEQQWFLNRLAPDVPNYNVPFRFTLNGPLRTDCLRSAIEEIVDRHDILRTSFQHTPDGLRQRVAPSATPDVPVRDLSTQDDPDAAAAQRCFELARTVFDPAVLPLHRFELLRLDARGTRHVLVWVASHLIADGGAVGVLVAELSASYTAHLAGRPTELPEVAVSFGDFALWQRNWLTDDRMASQLDYWREQLAGYPGLGLCYDHPGQDGLQLSGRTQRFVVPPDTAERVAVIARQLGASPFMVLLAVYQILLARLSGRNDVAVATPLAGRDRAEFESVVGCLTNTVVLRTRLSGDPTFAEVVRQTRAVALDAFAHQDLPFGKLVEELRPARNGHTNPIAETIFSYGGTPLMRTRTPFGPELTLRCDGMSNDTVRFDFELVLDATVDGLTGRFEYNIDRIDPASALLFCQRYLSLLDLLLTDPDQPLSTILPDDALRSRWTSVAKTADAEPSADTADTAEAAKADAEIEQRLAALWAKALGVERVGRDEDFFGAGGYSLLAVELINEINAEFGCDLPVLRIFQASTVAELAKSITAQPRHSNVRQRSTEELLRAIEDMSEDDVIDALAARQSHS